MAPTIGDFFTAVPGVVHATKIPASVGEILIRNDSPYDQWVKFNFAPTAAPSPLTFAQYDLEVTPGREQIIPPPGFNGGLWIGCYNPGGKAASGTISSRANVYVRYYPQGQSAGAGAAYSALTGLDTTSQQRVISIPTEPHVDGQFAANVSGGGTVNANIFLAIGQTFSGAQPVTCYLYGLDIAIEGFAYGDIELEWLELDNSNAIIASHPFGKMVMQAERPRSLPLQSALPLQFFPLATCTSIAFGIRASNTFPSTAQTVFAPQVVGTILADIDLTGQVPPPAIGNGAGTPPGAIY